MKGETIKCKDWNNRRMDNWKYFRNYDGTLKQSGWITHCPACKDHYFWTRTKKDAQHTIRADYKRQGVL